MLEWENKDQKIFIFFRLNFSPNIYTTSLILGLTDQNVLDIIRDGLGYMYVLNPLNMLVELSFKKSL